MSYKAAFSLFFLLCPETFRWFPVEAAALKLDSEKYARFDEEGLRDDDGDVDVDRLVSPSFQSQLILC